MNMGKAMVAVVFEQETAEAKAAELCRQLDMAGADLRAAAFVLATGGSPEWIRRADILDRVTTIGREVADMATAAKAVMVRVWPTET